MACTAERPFLCACCPRPAAAAFVFRRTDLDNFEIPATGRDVAKVSYATSLMRQGVLISTTEHLLSALIGTGVDNVIVELDNLELPILDDGDALRRHQTQRRREYLRIRKTVEVHEGDKFIGVYPGEGYSVSYKIDFPSPIGRQGFVVDLATRDYGAQIAPARTFGFKEDEEKLRNMGLISAASPESNAIILNGKGVINGPLRFNDEFVRHKVLDLIGDLALAGHHILGHVVAERAGHAMHTALVARLLKDRSAWELVTLGQQKQKLKSRISARTPRSRNRLIRTPQNAALTQTPGTAASRSETPCPVSAQQTRLFVPPHHRDVIRIWFATSSHRSVGSSAICRGVLPPYLLDPSFVSLPVAGSTWKLTSTSSNRSDA